MKVTKISEAVDDHMSNPLMSFRQEGLDRSCQQLLNKFGDSFRLLIDSCVWSVLVLRKLNPFLFKYG